MNTNEQIIEINSVDWLVIPRVWGAVEMRTENECYRLKREHCTLFWGEWIDISIRRDECSQIRVRYPKGSGSPPVIVAIRESIPGRTSTIAIPTSGLRFTRSLFSIFGSVSVIQFLKTYCQ